MTTIDLSVTWGEWANVYSRMATNGELKALDAMRGDLARVCAAAQALDAIQAKLPDDLKQQACQIVIAELTKQGF